MSTDKENDWFEAELAKLEMTMGPHTDPDKVCFVVASPIGGIMGVFLKQSVLTLCKNYGVVEAMGCIKNAILHQAIM